MSEELRISRAVFDPDAARAAGRSLYMCRHQSGTERSIAEITASHDLDLMFQEQYGVRWLTYLSSAWRAVPSVLSAPSARRLRPVLCRSRRDARVSGHRGGLERRQGFPG
jgi:hypothetical protein